MEKTVEEQIEELRMRATVQKAQILLLKGILLAYISRQDLTLFAKMDKQFNDSHSTFVKLLREEEELEGFQLIALVQEFLGTIPGVEPSSE